MSGRSPSAFPAPGRDPSGAGGWTIIRKGDAAVPNVRGRYAAKDIACYKDDSMFAATPPSRR
eukprot:14626690-Alexandrium_andersonii.AAC.1